MKDKKQKRCLIEEAREKCQCESCKNMREWEEISRHLKTEARILEILRKSMKNFENENLQNKHKH